MICDKGYIVNNSSLSDNFYRCRLGMQNEKLKVRIVFNLTIFNIKLYNEESLTNYFNLFIYGEK